MPNIKQAKMGMIKSYIRENFSLIALSVLIFYFFMAAVQGQMGFFRLLQVNAQIEVADKQLATITEERKLLENLTHRLSNQYLDLDLLDEQARKRLGMVRDNEIIIR